VRAGRRGRLPLGNAAGPQPGIQAASRLCALVQEIVGYRRLAFAWETPPGNGFCTDTDPQAIDLVRHVFGAKVTVGQRLALPTSHRVPPWLARAAWPPPPRHGPASAAPAGATAAPAAPAQAYPQVPPSVF